MENLQLFYSHLLAELSVLTTSSLAARAFFLFMLIGSVLFFTLLSFPRGFPKHFGEFIMRILLSAGSSVGSFFIMKWILLFRGQQCVYWPICLCVLDLLVIIIKNIIRRHHAARSEKCVKCVLTPAGRAVCVTDLDKTKSEETKSETNGED